MAAVVCCFACKVIGCGASVANQGCVDLAFVDVEWLAACSHSAVAAVVVVATDADLFLATGCPCY